MQWLRTLMSIVRDAMLIAVGGALVGALVGWLAAGASGRRFGLVAGASLGLLSLVAMALDALEGQGHRRVPRWLRILHRD